MSTMALEERTRRLLWMSFDVDGVLTDGSLFYGASGESFKRFNALDGHGIKQLQGCGVGILILSGRSHPSVDARARELGIGEVIQGAGDKLAALHRWLDGKGVHLEQLGHMGDDLPDLPVFKAVGFAASVPNAHPVVLDQAHWILRRAGGDGAVRELCDLIIEGRR